MTADAPYGEWASPISADALVEKVVGLSDPVPGGADLCWVEMRPQEKGRYALVRRDASGTVSDVLPHEFGARTLVHEYGGLSYALGRDTIWFSNFADQRLYRIATDGSGHPEPVSPETPTPGSLRFADPELSADERWVVCIRENHEDGEVINEVVAVPTRGGPVKVLATGHDFYSAPRLNPNGTRLAWLSWDHPRMPWDGTELWEAEVSNDLEVGPPRLVAGGAQESVSQPRWSPSGVLHFVSDRSGWWNIYAVRDGEAVSVAPADAEFSGPDWMFGQCTYTFLDDGSLVASWIESGMSRLGVMAPGTAHLEPVETAYTVISSVRPFSSGVVALVAGASIAPELVEITIPGGDVRVLRRSRDLPVPADYLSEPEAIEFPTQDGYTAHALYYPPANPDFEGLASELPPLIVVSHGGPTSATSSALNLRIQFWTSRGIAVVDVNYRGSTGYGRGYRRLLNGQWGIADVDDCINAARYLARQGRVDGDRMAIRGGSAGGYTTLCAVTFHDVFACGGSHYGVADAGALAQDTHKFESRYLDGLIGPWPEARAVYEARSPIFHTDRLRTPLIVFQGLEDKIVPPSQAETMVEALRAKGVPFAYIAYEGEQHGFRQAANIKRTAQSELAFYGRVLGFTPAGDLPELVIENADALPG